MFTNASPTVAKNHSDKALKFLSSHNIAPNPINYSVVYLYHSGESESLSKKIDQQLVQHNTVDGVFLESLFLDHINHTNNLENQFFTPFDATLKDTIDYIEQQVACETQTESNLNKVNDTLSNQGQVSSEVLLKLVHYMQSSVCQSREQHTALLSELSQTRSQLAEIKKLLEASRQEALFDNLTGLYNRRGCDEKLDDLDDASTHTSLVIDIDRFKSINDNYGHLIGDKVIQRVADTIKNFLIEDDFAVRYGGEEFLVLFVNKDKSYGKAIAENIRNAVTELKLKHRKTNAYLPSISVSIGIAQRSSGEEWHDVFNSADKALYQAKSTGRNKCVMA
ncbi:GGDEF domain-containing protein [Thalassotalea fusca]